MTGATGGDAAGACAEMGATMASAAARDDATMPQGRVMGMEMILDCEGAEEYHSATGCTSRHRPSVAFRPLLAPFGFRRLRPPFTSALWLPPSGLIADG